MTTRTRLFYLLLIKLQNTIRATRRLQNTFLISTRMRHYGVDSILLPPRPCLLLRPILRLSPKIIIRLHIRRTHRLFLRHLARLHVLLHNRRRAITRRTPIAVSRAVYNNDARALEELGHCARTGWGRDVVALVVDEQDRVASGDASEVEARKVL
jgi:hypothetical protein